MGDEVKTDIFFMPSWGNKGHLDQKYGWRGFEAPLDANDTRVSTVFQAVKPWTVHFEVQRYGDCHEIDAYYLAVGINRKCRNNPILLQVLDIDRCFNMVLRAQTKYELIVRLRPDIGVFRPIPYSNLPNDRISYTAKAQPYGDGWDYFFIVPPAAVKPYWEDLFL